MLEWMWEMELLAWCWASFILRGKASLCLHFFVALHYVLLNGKGNLECWSFFSHKAAASPATCCEGASAFLWFCVLLSGPSGLVSRHLAEERVRVQPQALLEDNGSPSVSCTSVEEYLVLDMPANILLWSLPLLLAKLCWRCRASQFNSCVWYLVLVGFGSSSGIEPINGSRCRDLGRRLAGKCGPLLPCSKCARKSFCLLAFCSPPHPS